MTRRQRGLTLLELLLSMALLLLALAGLFAALSSAVRGGANSRRIAQGSARARAVLENIMGQQQSVLSCLASTVASSWSSCETLCQQQLGTAVAPASCMFSTLSLAGLDVDSTGQAYAVVYDPSTASASSWVQAGGVSGHVYDIEVTVGWNNGGAATPVTHKVTMHAAVFR